MTKNPDITFTVEADTLEEAAQFAITHLQDITLTKGYTGFLAPELTADMYLRTDTGWTHAYEFNAELLPPTT